MMKYFSRNFFVFLFLIIFIGVSVPTMVFSAQHNTSGLIPCGHGVNDQCTFADLMALGRNIVNFLILLSIPLAAIAFAYSGFLLLTAGGDVGKRGKAKEIFVKVLWGFIFVISAWLIVYTFTRLTGNFLPSAVRLN